MAIAVNKGVTLYTVTATGAGTAYTDEPVYGLIVSIQYVKNNFTDGVDFTITGETSGVSLWTDTDVNASEIVYPLVLGNLNTSGAALSATYQMIALYGERISFVTASGGASNSGTFKVVVIN